MQVRQTGRTAVKYTCAFIVNVELRVLVEIVHGKISLQAAVLSTCTNQ